MNAPFWLGLALLVLGIAAVLFVWANSTHSDGDLGLAPIFFGGWILAGLGGVVAAGSAVVHFL